MPQMFPIMWMMIYMFILMIILLIMSCFFSIFPTKLLYSINSKNYLNKSSKEVSLFMKK